jgi:hypothetical protein
MVGKQKQFDINKWLIPAFLLIGIGIGLLLVEEFPLAIPAYTLIGVGLGIFITHLTSRKEKIQEGN